MPTNPPSKDEIVELITILAKAMGLDVQQSLRQCEEESSFNVLAHNQKTDALGLFQLEAPTARQMGVRRTIPEENVFGGLKYVRALKEEFGGDVEKAYAAYDWGPGNLAKLIESHPNDWQANLPVETRNYVRVILALPNFGAPPAA